MASRWREILGNPDLLRIPRSSTMTVHIFSAHTGSTLYSVCRRRFWSSLLVVVGSLLCHDAQKNKLNVQRILAHSEGSTGGSMHWEEEGAKVEREFPGLGEFKRLRPQSSLILILASPKDHHMRNSCQYTQHTLLGL